VIDGIIRGQLTSKRNWATAVQTYRSALVTYRRLLEQRADRIAPPLMAIEAPPIRSEHVVTHTPRMDGDTLTPREREVVELLARGYSNQHIAEALVLTRGTVANHVAHILAKLGAANRTQVAAWVFDRTVVVGDESEVDERRHRLAG
jgi:DNA-binding NarL/FixJ family response regulator